MLECPRTKAHVLYFSSFEQERLARAKRPGPLPKMRNGASFSIYCTASFRLSEPFVPTTIIVPAMYSTKAHAEPAEAAIVQVQWLFLPDESFRPCNEIPVLSGMSRRLPAELQSRRIRARASCESLGTGAVPHVVSYYLRQGTSYRRHGRTDRHLV